MGSMFRAGRLRAVLLAGVLASGVATPAGAAVTVTTSRSEAIFSADVLSDCSKLHALQDGALPLNVVRLRANVDGAGPDVRYKWSVPPGQVGTLAADLDLGPADETTAIRAMCADFGNACALTADKLPFYNYPTVLWVGPTCDVLADKKQRRAVEKGTVRVGVTVTEGRRRVGRANTTLGLGRAASASLFVDGREGGPTSNFGVDINPFFGGTVAATGMTLPTAGVFQFENGAGGFAAVASCPGKPARDPNAYDACAGSLFYQSVGTYLATLKERFDEGSALCAATTVHVLTTVIKPQLIVKATPSGTYVPGDPTRGMAHLTVTLRNASPHNPHAGIALLGSNVLTCDSEVKIAGTTDHRQTTFDFQHCSVSHDQPCASDQDCSPFFCPDCAMNETCLMQAHCSQTVTQACQGDIDCEKPTCASCVDDEHCIQVLSTPQAGVEPGDSLILVDKVVALGNIFPSTATVEDTWTVNTFNAGPATARLRYRIKPAPAP